MITIGYAYGASDLALTLAVLEAHGFVVRAEHRAMGTTVTSMTTAIGGIAVSVPHAEAADAARLMAELPSLVHSRAGAWAVMLFVLGVALAAAPPPATGLFLRRHALTATPA